MSIYYITGRSGTGKTMRVYQEIKKALDEGRDRLILMVPEQFTLQAERDLIQKLDLPGILNVEILSFSRLAHKVFSEVGGLTRTHINDQGRHMILRKLLGDIKENLTVYKTVSRQDGFIDKINELLSELKKHDIIPEQMREKAANLDSSGLLSRKLLDIALIYETFNGYLQDRYLDSEDSINALIEKMENAGFLKGAQIWMDGFDYFPPQTVRVIDKLINLAEKLSITFTIGGDAGESDQDIFQIHALSLKKIRALARENNIEEHFTHLNLYNQDKYASNNKCVRNKAPEILYLERELYQYPYQPYIDNPDHLEVFAGNNLQSEVENLAARIIYLAREKNWRFNEIAVVSGDMDSYGSIIKRVFTEYEIPYFLDEKRPVIQNPIIDILLISLRVIDRGYRYEDVFKLLKTGFCGLNIAEVEVLENYCLEFGIKGKKWQEPFTLGESDYPLSKLNDCRERFIKPYLFLENGLKRKKTIEDMVKALYQFLEEIELEEQLESWIEELRAKGLLDQVDENAQIWNIVMETLDQLVEILGEQRVQIGELIRILESGFSSLEVGIIPTTLDQVLVGNIQRSKSQDVKALFVVGCNDGILPSGKSADGLLADEERDILHGAGMELGSNSELRAADEKFGIYTAFSKPSDFLWISYALSDLEGKAMRPSILIDRLKKLFKSLEVSSDVIMDDARQRHLIATPNSTYKYMVDHMRCCADGKPGSDLWWQIYNWYFDHNSWDVKRKALLEGLFHRNQEAPIGKNRAADLYSAPICASVSRLEQYVNCPFAHFVRYGLRPRERKMYTVTAPDLGELFHRSIEGFTRKLAEDNLNWRDLDDKQCETMIDEVMDNILPDHNHGILLSTNRYKYLANRLKRISKRAVWLLTDHVKRSSFTPIGNEISFGVRGSYPPIEIELNNGEQLLLEGRIDRADIYREGEDVYINVIDYKSGFENFDLSDAYFGLKLQLLVYLEALLDVEQRHITGKAKPGGIFYFKIDDPLIDTQEQMADAIQNEIRKKLKLKGLVLKDVNIVKRMDSYIDGNSEVLPLGVKKDDTFYANSSVLGEEEFFDLLGHVRHLIKDIGTEMLQGKIRIEPVKKGDDTACKYCPFDGICQFDNQLEDNGYKLIHKLNGEEVIERIKKRKEESGDGKLDR